VVLEVVVAGDRELVPKKVPVHGAPQPRVPFTPVG